MRIRMVKSLILGTAILLASAVSASAQASSVSAGLVLGSVGVAVDYSKQFKEVGNAKPLSGVGEVGFMHEGCGNALVDCSFTQILAGGGLRIGGKINDKTMWHGQGLIVFSHFNAGGDIGDLCDIVGADCGTNDVGFMPGFIIDFKTNANSKMSWRGRVDILAVGGGSDGRLFLGAVWSK